MVESKKIDLDPLSEKDRMTILKKQQSIEEKQELERRLEELNEKKNKLKKKIEKKFYNVNVFLYIEENYFLYIMIFHLLPFHYSKWLTK